MAAQTLPLPRGNSARTYCAIKNIAYLPCEDFSVLHVVTKLYSDSSFTQKDLQAALLQRIKSNDAAGLNCADRSAQSELLLEWCHSLHNELTALVNTGHLSYSVESQSYKLCASEKRNTKTTTQRTTTQSLIK